MSGGGGTRGLLAAHPIVPVVVIDDAAIAVDAAAALAAGGIRCAEITLRTRAGLPSIAAIAAAAIPGFTVGVGTVLSPDDLRAAADAGARFAVSPGLDPELVDLARELGLAPLPGVATPTEVQRGVRCGVDAVKFFPADRLGGLATIAAIAAAFVDVGFVPSGGVGVGNLREYLAHPAILAVSGSWMVPRQALAAGDLDAVAALSRDAVALVGAGDTTGPTLDGPAVGA